MLNKGEGYWTHIKIEQKEEKIGSWGWGWEIDDGGEERGV